MCRIPRLSSLPSLERLLWRSRRVESRVESLGFLLVLFRFVLRLWKVNRFIRKMLMCFYVSTFTGREPRKSHRKVARAEKIILSSRLRIRSRRPSDLPLLHFILDPSLPSSFPQPTTPKPTHLSSFFLINVFLQLHCNCSLRSQGSQGGESRNEAGRKETRRAPVNRVEAFEPPALTALPLSCVLDDVGETRTSSSFGRTSYNSCDCYRTLWIGS